MNLFIDTISNQGKVIVFDDNRKIIDSLEWAVK